MSKPVTNVEIEDVLSSIRRLVSSSDREERPEQDVVSEEPEKLVLTPSLRVDDVANGAREVAEDQPVTDDTSSDIEDDLADADGADAPEAEATQDDEFLEMIAKSAAPEEEADESTAEADEAELTETAEPEDELSALDEILEENVENSQDFDLDALTDQEPETAGENPPDIEADETGEEDAERPEMAAEESDTDMAEALTRRTADFESFVAKMDEQWEPDGTTEDDNAGSSVGPLPWDDEEAAPIDAAAPVEDPSDLSQVIFQRSAQPDTPDEADMQPDTDEIADATEAHEVGPEDMVTAPEEEAPAPLTLTDPIDTVQEFDTAQGSEAGGAETVMAALAGQSEDDASNALSEGDDAPLGLDEALIDEEALREMVSDIVRQELQGALGERITRNVRKLVRREIHRALASQELE